MNDTLSALLNVLMVFIEYVTFLILSHSFFQFRRAKKEMIEIALVAFGIYYCSLLLVASMEIIKIIWCCVLFAILSKLLYRIHVIHGVFLAVLFLSLSYGTDGLVMLLVTVLVPSFSNDYLVNPYLYYLIAFSAKLVLFLIVSIIFALGKEHLHYRATTTKNYLQITIFPAAALLCTVPVLHTAIAFSEAAPELLICVVILLIADITSVILLEQFERQQRESADHRILQQQLQMAHDQIDTLKNSYSSERKLTHEFQNQMMLVRGMLEETSGNEAAIQYLSQFTDYELRSTLAISTHRTVVDVILKQKYAQAQKDSIALRIQLDNMESFPLDDDLLTIVLLNLLDNAIEACRKIAEQDRRSILVKAQVASEGSTLYVANTTAYPVKIKNGRIASTKANEMRHGYGLQNVCSIIEASGGTYALDYSDGEFSFIAYFTCD